MKTKSIAAFAMVAVLALTGVVAAEEVCTEEDFDGVGHDQYIGMRGGLDFGNNFAGFDQSIWFNANGSYLWPQCADDLAWMPAEGGITSTSNPLTRIIEFKDGCCILTKICVASHEPTPGDLVVRALDSENNQVGSPLVYNGLDISDGCVELPTGFTECAAKIEISYTRGSELAILCLEYCCGEDEGGEGCTPGYWKANLKKNAGSNWPISANTDFDSYFGVNFFNPNINFGEAIALGGGGNNALARHAVAAILNALSGNVDYPFTTAEIIAMVQAGGEANKDLLDEANNAGCPLDNND